MANVIRDNVRPSIQRIRFTLRNPRRLHALVMACRQGLSSFEARRWCLTMTASRMNTSFDVCGVTVTGRSRAFVMFGRVRITSSNCTSYTIIESLGVDGEEGVIFPMHTTHHLWIMPAHLENIYDKCYL